MTRLLQSHVKCSAKGGFTLLEALLYVVLLVIISVFVVGAILSMARAASEVRLSRAINNSAAVSLERMVRDIREADEIDETGSIFGTHPGRLTLRASDDDGNSTTTEFELDADDILTVEVNAGGQAPLTAEELEVSNLIFRQIVSSSSRAVKIELAMRNRRGKRIIERNYYDTAVLRGTYE